MSGRRGRNNAGGQTAAALGGIGRSLGPPASVLASTRGVSSGDDGGWLSGLIDDIQDFIGGGSGSSGSGSSGSSSSASGSSGSASGGSSGSGTTVDPFQRVKNILDAAVQGAPSLGPHGAFWRGVSRDDFVTLRVLGYDLIDVRNGAGSNLVKALKGEAPFDASGPFRRMPAGRPPVSAGDIAFIKQWIDDGCPTGSPPQPYSGGGGAPPPIAAPTTDHSVSIDLDAGSTPLAASTHLAYWREFDNWAMFRVAGTTRGDIAKVMQAKDVWMAYAKGSRSLSDWEAALAPADVQSAIERLSVAIKATVVNHYGSSPVRMAEVFESYQDFGADDLPADPLRPADPQHTMNGPSMWFVWAAFIDACIRLDIHKDFNRAMAKAVIVGLCNDGLFRGRYPVDGYSSSAAQKAATQAQIITDAKAIANRSLQGQLRARYRDSRL